MTRDPLVLDRRSTHALAKGLGWFSVGLGLAELCAPRPLARWLGMRDGEALLRSYGLRELTAGIGLLTARDPRPWIIARTGGDALDLATLALTFRRDNDKNLNVGLALAAVLGVTMADVVCTDGLCREKVRAVERRRVATRDYSRRSGFRRPPEEMRGAARDFNVPEDFRTPSPMRPFAPALVP